MRRTITEAVDILPETILALIERQARRKLGRAEAELLKRLAEYDRFRAGEAGFSELLEAFEEAAEVVLGTPRTDPAPSVEEVESGINALRARAVRLLAAYEARDCPELQAFWARFGLPLTFCGSLDEVSLDACRYASMRMAAWNLRSSLAPGDALMAKADMLDSLAFEFGSSRSADTIRQAEQLINGEPLRQTYRDLPFADDQTVIIANWASEAGPAPDTKGEPAFISAVRPNSRDVLGFHPMFEQAVLGVAVDCQWEISDAALFAIVGPASFHPAIRGWNQVHVSSQTGICNATSRIGLTVDPRVEPRVVMARYQKAREAFLQHDRPMAPKSLALAMFAADMAPSSKLSEDDRNRWNDGGWGPYLRDSELGPRQPSEWAYNDLATFRREADAAHNRILYFKRTAPKNSDRRKASHGR